MHKKICILNGSPRANGNTKELIKSFTLGATESGHEVVCFDLQKMNIHSCLGCCKGGKENQVHVYKKMIWNKFTQYMKKRMLWC